MSNKCWWVDKIHIWVVDHMMMDHYEYWPLCCCVLSLGQLTKLDFLSPVCDSNKYAASSLTLDWSCDHIIHKYQHKHCFKNDGNLLSTWLISPYQTHSPDTPILAVTHIACSWKKISWILWPSWITFTFKNSQKIVLDSSCASRANKFLMENRAVSVQASHMKNILPSPWLHFGRLYDSWTNLKASLDNSIITFLHSNLN